MHVEILKKTIDWYVNKMQRGECFSFPGYSDAEWFSILHYDEGKATGLGQILHGPTGDRLLESLVRHDGDPAWMPAVPDVMWTGGDMQTAEIGLRIDNLIKKHGVEGPFYDRDLVTDGLAERAGLHPFIAQLQQMSVVVVGNEHLRSLRFLNYKHFVEVGCPNFHLEPGGIERAVRECLDYGRPAVYCVSAGMSAALIIDQLHGELADSWLIDCGSIWDAFVGIGGQRRWRADLYADPYKHQEWIDANLQPRD